MLIGSELNGFHQRPGCTLLGRWKERCYGVVVGMLNKMHALHELLASGPQEAEQLNSAGKEEWFGKH